MLTDDVDNNIIKNHYFCNCKQFDIVPHLLYCSSQISHSPSLTFARNNLVEVLEIYTNNIHKQ